MTTPGLPGARRAAPLFAGAEVVELPLTAERGWLPDLDAVDWAGVALLWLNSPNNPTAATAPLELYERGRRAGPRATASSLACDEAYSELWFAGEPPASALQVADRTNVLVFNTLSKRSSMPGYRSGFAAGRPGADRRAQALPARTSAWRPRRSSSARRSPPGATRSTSPRPARATRAKRDVLLPALRAAGLEPAGGDASFFLWLRVGRRRRGASRWRCSRSAGSSWRPGPFFGPGGEGHVRAALVPTLERCREAAARLAA